MPDSSFIVTVGFRGCGLESDASTGAGVEEIRLRHFSGAYRVIYLARFAEVE